MGFPPSLKQQQHYNQWLISKLSLVPFSRFLTLLLLISLVQTVVHSQNVDYFYGHHAYPARLLRSHFGRNREQPVVIVPAIDEYNGEPNYPANQFNSKSSSVESFGRVAGAVRSGGEEVDNSLFKNHGNQGQGIGSYSYEPDQSHSSAIKGPEIPSRKVNQIFQRLFQQPKSQSQPHHHQQLRDNDEKRATFGSSAEPVSQLKTSSISVDDESSRPMTMYTRASSSARIGGSSRDPGDNVLFVGTVVGFTCAGIVVVIATGYFVHRINIQRRAAADVEYPAYGVVGPGASMKEKEAAGVSNGLGTLSPSGDRRLAQSAQMYHYHRQKQQMISSEKATSEAGGRHTSTSDIDSEEEENEEGDYTVYECPGLASTGEMEVKNPLFQDDITPISSPCVKDNDK